MSCQRMSEFALKGQTRHNILSVISSLESFTAEDGIPKEHSLSTFTSIFTLLFVRLIGVLSTWKPQLCKSSVPSDHTQDATTGVLNLRTKALRALFEAMSYWIDYNLQFVCWQQSRWARRLLGHVVGNLWKPPNSLVASHSKCRKPPHSSKVLAHLPFCQG